MRPPPKSWPTGKCHLKPFSKKLADLMKRMTDKNPSKRPSFFKISKELMDLAKSSPMPHPFWAEKAILAKGSPQRSFPLQIFGVSDQGKNIAAQCGIEPRSQVQVRVGTTWHDGHVEHISL